MAEETRPGGSIFGSSTTEEFVRDVMLSQDIAAEIVASLGESKALEVAREIIRLLAPEPDDTLH
jgi:hypothetical protein